MDKNIWYTALYVIDPQKLIKEFKPIHSKVFAHHSTIAFKPETLDGIELGKTQKLKIIGRAFDDKGDALLVENLKSKNKFPHITLSCAEGIDPVYSNELLEKAYKNKTIKNITPYYIDVIEGYENFLGEVLPKSIKAFNTTEVLPQ